MSPLPSSRNRRSEYVPGPVAPFTGDVIRAIERTLKEYCYLIDANDRVGVVDLFSEDCVGRLRQGVGRRGPAWPRPVATQASRRSFP